MISEIYQAHDDGHVQAFKVGSEFIWRKFFFVCDVEVEASKGRFVKGLDVVYLLSKGQLIIYSTTYGLHFVETSDQSPQFVIW
jgi:hypothetical protein